MKSTITLITALLLGSMSYAQYCMSGGPTSTADSNVQLVRLVGQNDSIHRVGCPGVLGVQDLTAESTTLQAGNTYTLYVQFGTCNGNYQGAGEIWIDYDQSQGYDTYESIGTWIGIPPVPISSYTFTVPIGAHNGATRMRVMQHEGATVTPPLDPCAAFQWGSVMDFTINITGGVDCSAYPGDYAATAIPVTTIPYTDTRDNSYCYTNRNPVYPSPDVFYRIIPAANTYSITASLCGSTFDTFISVIDTGGNVIAYNDDYTACAPQSSMTFLTAGIDTAYIIVEGWGTAQGVYTLNITQNFVGIDELSTASFSIFPNPAQDQFFIKGLVGSDVRIVDAIGKTVSVISNYRGEAIATQTLEAGIYFACFDYEGQLHTEKIIITK